MKIGSIENPSANFIQPDWLKKGQLDEMSLSKNVERILTRKLRELE